MAKNKNQKEQKPVLNLDGKEYDINDMTDDQKVIISHVQDLARKIESTKFNLQQMEVGKDAFVKLLKDELTKDED
jgi:hypothetical protein|tara:strand:- start:21628 stop:21852 length:225 start_codon:yes stop_codon:yes gene_type:complete